jgi:hypothetical protein
LAKLRSSIQRELREEASVWLSDALVKPRAALERGPDDREWSREAGLKPVFSLLNRVKFGRRIA